MVESFCWFLPTTTKNKLNFVLKSILTKQNKKKTCDETKQKMDRWVWYIRTGTFSSFTGRIFWITLSILASIFSWTSPNRQKNKRTKKQLFIFLPKLRKKLNYFFLSRIWKECFSSHWLAERMLFYRKKMPKKNTKSWNVEGGTGRQTYQMKKNNIPSWRNYCILW